MAKRLLLRDAENISADMLQRLVGGDSAGIGAIAGVGTGFAMGGVGKMNSNWLGTASLPTGHLVVSANGTTMVLAISPGWATILRDVGTSTFDPRAFFAESDANDSVTVSANATGSTRNDTVCMKIDLGTAPTSDGSNLVSFEILAGAAGGGLANAPADGNLHLPIANIAVANGATNIAQGNVTDKRIWMPTGINPFKARGFVTTPQAAFATGTNTKINIDTTTYDPNGNLDLTNHRYVAPVNGFYAVSATVSFAGAVPGVEAAIFKNGVVYSRGSIGAGVAASNSAGSVSDVVLLNIGDFVEVWALQCSGGNLADIAGAAVTYLSVALLSGF